MGCADVSEYVSKGFREEVGYRNAHTTRKREIKKTILRIKKTHANEIKCTDIHTHSIFFTNPK